MTLMKTMTLKDSLYSALEEEARRSGRTINELVTEIVESWLSEFDLDNEEHAEIELARSEAAEQGGVEFEEFFDDLLQSSR